MFEDLSRELANKQAAYTEEVIASKLKTLEAEMRLRDINGLHGAFIHKLNILNHKGYSYNNVSRFLVDISKIGYTLSIDYLPGYSKTEYKGSSITTYIDPTKIELTVTYKVISF
ncbi:TPA: hypothetical protein ACSVZR_003481 [Bacillus cereus]